MKLSWCDNAKKIKKRWLVAVPLLLMQPISIQIVVNNYSTNSKIIIYIVIITIFYIGWVATIFFDNLKKFKLHEIFGALYLVAISILTGFKIFSLTNLYPTILYTFGIILIAVSFLSVIKNKKVNTLHEIQIALALIIYHLVIVIS